MLRRFLKDTTGATAIEYAPIAAGISIAIVVAVTAIGTSVNTMFTRNTSAQTYTPGSRLK
jgi:pilus assembly protein Flp/PilA